jgi:hypothetical protein
VRVPDQIDIKCRNIEGGRRRSHEVEKAINFKASEGMNGERKYGEDERMIPCDTVQKRHLVSRGVEEVWFCPA